MPIKMYDTKYGTASHEPQLVGDASGSHPPCTSTAESGGRNDGQRPRCMMRRAAVSSLCMQRSSLRTHPRTHRAVHDARPAVASEHLEEQAPRLDSAHTGPHADAQSASPDGRGEAHLEEQQARAREGLEVGPVVDALVLEHEGEEVHAWPQS